MRRFCSSLALLHAAAREVLPTTQMLFAAIAPCDDFDDSQAFLVSAGPRDASFAFNTSSRGGFLAVRECDAFRDAQVVLVEVDIAPLGACGLWTNASDGQVWLASAASLTACLVLAGGIGPGVGVGACDGSARWIAMQRSDGATRVELAELRSAPRRNGVSAGVGVIGGSDRAVTIPSRCLAVRAWGVSPRA